MTLLKRERGLLLLLCFLKLFDAGAFLSAAPLGTFIATGARVQTCRPGRKSWGETSVPLGMKKKNADNEETKKTSSFLDTLKEKPATLIALPFVALLGVDLVLNLLVITKRTLEFFLLGQAPSSQPWW